MRFFMTSNHALSFAGSENAMGRVIALTPAARLHRLRGVQNDPGRRFVGGADPVPPNRWDEDEARRWHADPVWQATTIAPDAELAEAADLAEWPVSRLTSWTQRHGRGPTVRDLIPDEFDAYLRILFPIFEPPGDRGHLEQLSTWHETALRNGRQPHRLMDLGGIGPDHDDGLHGGTQVPQTLASTQAAALLAILENCTASARSWFVLWYGDYHGSAVIPEQSLIEIDQGPSSPYCVFTGPHRAWRDFWTYPRWWWPQDRAWCWQTGLDLDMTNCAYLGTSHDCAEEIFASTAIEAVVAQPDDPAWVGMDNVNRQ
jgi:hypothetical protein